MQRHVKLVLGWRCVSLRMSGSSIDDLRMGHFVKPGTQYEKLLVPSNFSIEIKASVLNTGPSAKLGSPALPVIFGFSPSGTTTKDTIKINSTSPGFRDCAVKNDFSKVHPFVSCAYGVFPANSRATIDFTLNAEVDDSNSSNNYEAQVYFTGATNDGSGEQDANKHNDYVSKTGVMCASLTTNDPKCPK